MTTTEQGGERKSQSWFMDDISNSRISNFVYFILVWSLGHVAHSWWAIVGIPIGVVLAYFLDKYC